MKLTDGCRDKLVSITVGTGVAAVETLATGVPGGTAFVASGLGGLLLNRGARASREWERVVSRHRRQVEAQWSTWGDTDTLDGSQLESAIASFNEVIPKIDLTENDIYALVSDPAPDLPPLSVRLAQRLLIEAAACHEGFADRGQPDGDEQIARRFFVAVVAGAHAQLWNDGDFREKHAPAIRERMAREIRLVRQDIVDLKVKMDELISVLTESEAEKAKLAETTGRLQADLGATQRLITGFLSSILRRDIGPEEIAPTLFELARDWQRVGERLADATGGNNIDPRLTDLRRQARDAYRAEDTETLWSLFTEIERIEEEGLAQMEAAAREVQEQVELRRARVIEA
ncbi:MAG: hypothetical protein AAFV86_19005, partial [Pseudomonadota bacterium]